MKPRPIDVIVNPHTGLISPKHGVSVESVPDGLERFGGAFTLSDIPTDLVVKQVGRRPTHHEILPAIPMTLAEYEAALGRIVLTPCVEEDKT